MHFLEALVPKPGVVECHACFLLPLALVWKNKVRKPIICCCFRVPEFSQSFCISSTKAGSRDGRTGHTACLAEHKATHPRSSQWVTVLRWTQWQLESVRILVWGSHWRNPKIRLSIPGEMCSTLPQWLELNWDPILPHRSHAGRDVICMVKNLQVPGISGLERALEFVLPETFVVLMSRMSPREAERQTRSWSVVPRRLVASWLAGFALHYASEGDSAVSVSGFSCLHFQEILALKCFIWCLKLTCFCIHIGDE